MGNFLVLYLLKWKLFKLCVRCITNKNTFAFKNIIIVNLWLLFIIIYFINNNIQYDVIDTNLVPLHDFNNVFIWQTDAEDRVDFTFCSFYIHILSP